ncbi:hypothetical protein [Kitasatospora kifunensis]|uniref:Htaa domain-containing protein n=1 Tax=Kitasatospora kifunensis TaxID=58351 RepID=A0A7W7R2S4_KITKI|nr:hypothetical protein [Kitasatospora kifunensis]MBB4924339.1 hypothetical protein [Kitasatospora kifunensis]
MRRTSVRIAAATVLTAALAVTGLSGSALAAGTTTTAPSGNLVVQEDNTFLQNAASNGVIAIALPNATPGFSTSTGFSATFPVTGGAVNLNGFYGNVQLGGGLLLVNVTNGHTVIFNNLAFNADQWSFTGVPLGQSTAVKLFDPARPVITAKGTTQTLQSSDLEIDAQGASYADTNLGTTFFTARQHAGTGVLTFTAGS